MKSEVSKLKNKMLKDLIIVLLIITVGVGGFYIYKNQKPQLLTSKNEENISVGTTETTVIEPTKGEITGTDKDDVTLIKEALYKKNNWTEETVVKVNLSYNDGTYAKGLVNGQGGGGLVFAKKVGDNWEIVADGNGVITCDKLINYADFPTGLIPECFNEKTGKVEKR